MLTELSCRELMDWLACYRADPFGAERGDLNSALIAQSNLWPWCKNADDLPELEKIRLKFGEEHIDEMEEIYQFLVAERERQRAERGDSSSTV